MVERRLGFALITIVATLTVAVCTVNSFERIGKPFPGFFVWENLFVPAVGEPSWTGISSGLHYHSWLLSADGRPLGNAHDLAEALRGKKPGETVGYVFEKGGQKYNAIIPVMTMDARVWASGLGIYLIEAWALLILGVVIIYMKSTDPAAQSMFLFTTTLALFIATSADRFGPYIFRIPYFYVENLVPLGGFAVLSYFPLGRQRRRFEDYCLLALLLLGLALGTASNLAFTTNGNLLLQLELGTYMLLAASIWAAILFFGWHFVRTRNHFVRQKTKVVMLGAMAAFVLPSVMLPAVYAWGLSVPFNFLTVFLIAWPLSIGYAIAQHDLFDIDRAIKRTLVYVTLSAFVLSIYALVITSIDYLFENLTQVASRVAEGVLILFLILITTPSMRRIQEIVDRLYDRRRYNYRDVIRSAAQTFTRILDFEELVRRVLRLLDDTMQPEMVRVYTVGGESTALLHGEIYHRADDNGDLRADIGGTADPVVTPLVEQLDKGDLVTADDDTRGGKGLVAARALRSVGGSLAVPMRLSGSLSGMVLVGAKRAGGHYGGDDVELLRTVSDQLAVALDNAQAYKTIDRLNHNLGVQNVALEEANRDLREAQDELVQKERLAAIGELSAAVAHAIRNPLAGIKAAAQLALFELSSHPVESTVADVVSETDRLTDRIAALLDFSKPFEPEVRPISLKHIAESAVRDTKSKAEGAEVKLEVDVSAKLGNVRVDTVLFEQAVIELISNAVDASPAGGTVTIRTGEDDATASAWLEVADSGSGIREAAKDRLFELFYTTKAKGTGFGLATVKKIIERHGGKIVAGNGPSGGACFRLILPVVTDEVDSA